jgi:hypothetical protein
VRIALKPAKLSGPRDDPREDRRRRANENVFLAVDDAYVDWEDHKRH